MSIFRECLKISTALFIVFLFSFCKGSEKKKIEDETKEVRQSWEVMDWASSDRRTILSQVKSVADIIKDDKARSNYLKKRRYDSIKAIQNDVDSIITRLKGKEDSLKKLILKLSK